MPKSLRVLLYFQETYYEVAEIKTHIQKLYPGSEIVVTENKEEFLELVRGENLGFDKVTTHVTNLSDFSTEELELLLNKGMVAWGFGRKEISVKIDKSSWKGYTVRVQEN